MKTVTISELRTGFAGLLAEVEGGETFVITRRGKPVARLVPVSEAARIAKVIDDIRESRRGNTLRGLSIRDLINEGRKY